MGLEEIKQEILQKAKASEKSILDEASKKVAEINKQTAKEIKQLEQESQKKLDAEIKSIESRENSLVNLEAQKMKIDAKKEATDKVYADGYSLIKNIPENDRKELLNKLLDKSISEIDVEKVYCNKNDTKLLDKSVQAETLDCDGGLICETKDGTVRVDYTFTTLFQDLREKTAKEISKILFV